MTEAKRSNRLIGETSPYLRQHAHNPVDWYPWGPEALERAKKEDKPIFLSIGYSACHWCHVMERESFENSDIAAFMNQNFINVKVDREERQDLDHIYMNAVQIMTRHGGWPMSVFLTPGLEPFYGGTYFPPEDRMGMPGFKKILAGVSNAWTTRNEEVLRSAKELSQTLIDINQSSESPDTGLPPLSLIDEAMGHYHHSYDADNGGFGSAPKFFHTMDLRVALRYHKRTNEPGALQMVTNTLEHWLRGGIYDQLRGGFHRYSTDAEWLVPHFEKMLYDNALVTEVFLEAYQVTKNPLFATVARETLDFVLEEMTSAEGAFFCTLDADSEGEEGKFYVWDKKEIVDALGNEAATDFCKIFGVTAEGNWEGRNILTLSRDCSVESRLQMEEARKKLLEIRSRRPRPGTDEKIIVSWNGMMIHTLALAYQVLPNSEKYLDAAKRAAKFLTSKLVTKEGGLLHVHKDGESKLNAYVDDYGQLINALVSLYESDFNPSWVDHAKMLSARMVDQFWDAEGRSFYFTGKDHESLIVRPKENYDGATPSGTSIATTALIRLGLLTGDTSILTKAESAIAASKKLLAASPSAVGQMLVNLNWLGDKPSELVFVAGKSKEDVGEVISEARSRFTPSAVVLFIDERTPLSHALAPNLEGKKTVAGEVTLYVCRNFSCTAPVSGLEAIRKTLEAL